MTEHRKEPQEHDRPSRPGRLEKRVQRLPQSLLLRPRSGLFLLESALYMNIPEHAIPITLNDRCATTLIFTGRYWRVAVVSSDLNSFPSGVVAYASNMRS